MQRHQPDARVAGALLLVDVRQQRQPIDEAAERRLRLAALVLARGRHELREVLDAALGVLAALLAQVLQVAALVEHLADRDRHRLAAARSRSALTIRSRNAASDAAARPVNAPLVERRARGAPRASWPTAPAAGRPASSGSVVDSVGRRDLLDRVHHALADAARRHVDHAPQADVVVRVDDEPHVGERVLDLLALVEPDAADDLVGDALRASARLRSCATARWSGTARRPSRRRRRPAPSRAVRVMKSASSSSSPPRKYDDAGAALAVGPEVLVLAVAVLADDGRRGVENDLRRAVVALELDDRRLRGKSCSKSRMLRRSAPRHL